MITFYGYTKCSTCRNALVYLRSRSVQITVRDLVEDPPSKEELRKLVERYGQGIEPFINRKGRHFRELGFTNAVYSDDEWLEQLAADGRLVRRPIVSFADGIVIGYDAAAYDAHIAVMV